MSKGKIDPYAILELSIGCSIKDIQKAYKVQCLKWHPDKNRGNEQIANNKFILAKEAFDILADPQSRKEYDEEKSREETRVQKHKERMEKADGERKRHIEQLHKREQHFEQTNTQHKHTHTQQHTHEKHVRRHFEELRKQLEEEALAEMKQQAERIEKQRQADSEDEGGILRVKWKDDNRTTHDVSAAFGRFGTIKHVSNILDTKKGGKQCVVEYEKGGNGADKVDGWDSKWIREPPPDRASQTTSTDPFSHLSYEELHKQIFGLHPEAKKARTE